MIYVLLVINILLSGAVLFFECKAHKKLGEKTEIEQKIVEEKIEMDNRERKFMEGISNVLNYDVDVAMKTLKGNWSEDA